MLRRLSLRDFVIVHQLDLDLQGGFTALTGETGAGKSILIDALQLALGSRGDAGVVREGASRTEISVEFELSAALQLTLKSWFEEAGFELDGGSSLLLRRNIDAQGKSRAWVNGSPATLAQLRELGDHLVEIHGQHAWQSLMRADAVRALIDEQAGVDVAALDEAWEKRRQASLALEQAQSRQGELNQERERLQWQLGELQKLAPQDDEWDGLQAEHTRLSHGQSILEATRLALDCIGEAEHSARSLAWRALGALESVLDVEPRLANAVEVLRDAQAHLDDATHSLNGLLSHLDLDPQRLRELDDRVSAWMALARRYRCAPEALTALLQSWSDELKQLDASADLDGLQHEVERTHEAWLVQARRASAARAKFAPELSKAVTAAMQDLGMAGGCFEVALVPQAQAHATGLESIELRVAGHEGSTPRPLAKVASGGELSRLALAIAVCTSGAHRGQHATLLFDEIDAGIGGTVADTVGQLLRRLAQSGQAGDGLGVSNQVLAVTHLAQVAACAHQQLVVSKNTASGSARSELCWVEGDARIEEIARMLGGAPGQTRLAHARALLQGAQSTAQASQAGSHAARLHESSPASPPGSRKTPA